MSVFERLLCLDSELMVLGTKMYIAKEELKDAIRYSKSSNVSYEDDKCEEFVEDTAVEECDDEKEWSYYTRMKQKANVIFAENRARNEREERERVKRLSEMENEEE